jgi:cell division inhibitor SepF
MAGVWRKTLVYLGLVEDDEDDYEEEEPQRRATGARRAPDDESIQERRPSGARRTPGAERVSGRRDAVVRAITPPSPAAAFHVVQPSSFNDAQEVGDKFRSGHAVLMNLQTADSELGRRLVDFASGLAYGLGGAIQPVADKVFLISPQGVTVSAEERRRFLEERGFFNQA